MLEQLPEGIVADVMEFMVGGLLTQVPDLSSCVFLFFPLASLLTVHSCFSLLSQVPYLSSCEADEGFLATLATRIKSSMMSTPTSKVQRRKSAPLSKQRRQKSLLNGRGRHHINEVEGHERAERTARARSTRATRSKSGTSNTPKKSAVEYGKVPREGSE